MSGARGVRVKVQAKWWTSGTTAENAVVDLRVKANASMSIAALSELLDEAHRQARRRLGLGDSS